MRQAIFVTGAESSGTRMLTECFVSLGYFGDCWHVQRMDDLIFTNRPERIVFRRSVPHGGEMPPLGKIVCLLKAAHYHVTPVTIFRDKDVIAKSQTKNSHVSGENEARLSIFNAHNWIYRELTEVSLFPITVCYQPFVKFESVRKNFFAQLGLPLPNINFREESLKYLNEYEWFKGVDFQKIGKDHTSRLRNN